MLCTPHCLCCRWAAQHVVFLLRVWNLVVNNFWLQELEIGTLQTALQALSASSNGPQQPAAHSHTAAALQPNTGVFCPQACASAAPQPLSADESSCGSIQKSTPATRLQRTQQQPAPVKKHRSEGRFQYPEDTPSTSQQVAGHKPQAEYTIPSSTCRQQDQHNFAQKACGHCHGQQPTAYTVEEPDSPVQPASTAQHGAHEEPSRASGMTAAGVRAPPQDPPAGCLYQDTTIRRVTTPLKNGKVSGAWAHHEEITLRQVRQINQSEARLHRLPPIHQPHVVQGEYIALESGSTVHCCMLWCPQDSIVCVRG